MGKKPIPIAASWRPASKAVFWGLLAFGVIFYLNSLLIGEPLVPKSNPTLNGATEPTKRQPTNIATDTFRKPEVHVAKVTPLLHQQPVRVLPVLSPIAEALVKAAQLDSPPPVESETGLSDEQKVQNVPAVCTDPVSDADRGVWSDNPNSSVPLMTRWFQPQDCYYKQFNQSAMCDLLADKTIFFVGDSLIERTVWAFSKATGPCRGAKHVGIGWERHNGAFDGKIHLAIGKRQPDYVYIGSGIHEIKCFCGQVQDPEFVADDIGEVKTKNYSFCQLHPYRQLIRSVLTNIKQAAPNARIFWVMMSKVELSKIPCNHYVMVQAHQNDDQVVLWNDVAYEVAKSLNIEIIPSYAITRDQANFTDDGVHYTPEIYAMHLQMMLNQLAVHPEARWYPPVRTAVAKPELKCPTGVRAVARKKTPAPEGTVCNSGFKPPQRNASEAGPRYRAVELPGDVAPATAPHPS